MREYTFDFGWDDLLDTFLGIETKTSNLWDFFMVVVEIYLEKGKSRWNRKIDGFINFEFKKIEINVICSRMKMLL